MIKRISRFIPTEDVGLYMTSESDWDFSTVGETDFYLSPLIHTATHMLIINANSPSNLPALLGVELARAHLEHRVGYISSKHILTKPHRLLSESNPMWPIFQYKTTLIVMVNSPPVISNNSNAQRNEWLFNYPPARDIAMRFKNLERIGTLSTYALNRLFIDPIALPKKCVVIRGEDLGKETDETLETLQSIWSWLTPQIAHLLGVKASIYLMPPETSKNDGRNKATVEPAATLKAATMLAAVFPVSLSSMV